MSNGVLCFANNNEINYIKQAEQLAIRIKKYMGLPTSLCTSDQYSNSGKIFDKIIKLKEGQPNNKRYYDTVDFKTLNFKNYSRCKSYDLSPYDKTLVLDVDYIITNNKLSDAFINGDFKIYRHGVDLCPWRKYKELKKEIEELNENLETKCIENILKRSDLNGNWKRIME